MYSFLDQDTIWPSLCPQCTSYFTKLLHTLLTLLVEIHLRKTVSSNRNAKACDPTKRCISSYFKFFFALYVYTIIEVSTIVLTLTSLKNSLVTVWHIDVRLRRHRGILWSRAQKPLMWANEEKPHGEDEFTLVVRRTFSKHSSIDSAVQVVYSEIK